MVQRTTLILDDETRSAARELATHYGCSTSEAIRRAVVSQRNAALGVSAEVRRRRKHALSRLIDLFEGSDPDAEVRRIKSQDVGF